MEIVVSVGLVLAAVYFWYVAIIGRRNKALEALSGVDVQLKQRSNLIPNILQIANKMMEHEKELMSEITQLREQSEKNYDTKDTAAVKEHLAASEKLAGKMAQFMVRMEQYPDIKSDATMVQAQQTYSEVEALIAAARRFYNASVTSLNNSVQIFPGNMIAGMAGVAEMPFYEGDEASKAPVDASAFLN
jgi:LemA protein